MSETRDTLLDLLKHPGWALYEQHCLHEWGVQGVVYNQELDAALNLTDPNAAHAQALQVRAARRMVETLLAWPAQEAARLGRGEEPEVVSMSRGGYHR